MTTRARSIEQEVDAHLDDTIAFLCKLISFPSLPGAEESAMTYLEETFSSQGFSVESIAMRDSLINDPEYSNPISGLRYNSRRNLRLEIPGSSQYRLILNAHVDVVPPSSTMQDPWIGRVQDGAIYGRGACDDKGQIAVLYLLLRTLVSCQIVPVPTLVIHLVAEEENGGNGTLAVLRNGERADGAIVLEPTDRTVVVAARGAIWFRITTTGKSAHSGESTTGCSALNMARKAMAAIEQYHDDLLSVSRSVPYFEQFENPMPLTFGILHSGDWPASTPSSACLEGVFGFLPNTNRDAVCEELKKRLQEALPDPNSYELKFTFRHDGFSINADSRLPRAVMQAASAAEYSSRAGPMLASSDAWLYKRFLAIPTVLFGAGSLKTAHSDNEFVHASDIRGVCLTLLHLVSSDCCQAWDTK